MTLKQIKEQAEAEGISPELLLIKLRESKIFGLLQANAYLAELDREFSQEHGWEIQEVCIDGANEFNGFQCYRVGARDEADPEMAGLFATEAEAWADARACELDAH